jgi:hypothetical protein
LSLTKKEPILGQWLCNFNFLYLLTSIFITKIVVSIPMSDPFPWPIKILVCRFYLIYVWNYFQECNNWKCMTWLNMYIHYLLNVNWYNVQIEIVVLQWLTSKIHKWFILFQKIYFLQVTLLHPKTYKPRIFWMQNLPQTILKSINLGE